MVILANSKKNHGRCIAGIDLNTDEWIRPINNYLVNSQINRMDKTVFMKEDLILYYKDPFGPQLGDVVKIGFKEKCPLKHQPENELIDGKEWEKIGKISFTSLGDFTTVNSCDLIHYFGDRTDIISDNQVRANPVKESLALLHLTEVEHETKIYQKIKPNKDPQTRISFIYEGYPYDLSLTDETYLNYTAKEYTNEELVQDCYVTIGLGELYEKTNAHHKFIVGFMPNCQRDRYEHR